MVPLSLFAAQNTIRSLISHMAAATGQGAGWRGCLDNVGYCALEQWNGGDRAWAPSFVKGNLKFWGAPNAYANENVSYALHVGRWKYKVSGLEPTFAPHHPDLLHTHTHTFNKVIHTKRLVARISASLINTT